MLKVAREEQPAVDHILDQMSDVGIYGYENNNGINLYDREPLSDQSIAQIRTLDHVESIRMDREMDIIAQLDTVPRYALLYGHQEQHGMLDDEQFQEALTINGVNSDWLLEYRDEMRKGYLQMKETYGFDGEAFQMSIMTMDLSKENIGKLKELLTDGSVNVDAINAGTQVLILAEEIWMHQDGQGGTQIFGVDTPAYDLYQNQGAVRVAWNDCFTVGQTVPLTQLYSENPDYSSVIRNDVTVQVCGILENLGDLPYGSRGNCIIITTEAGLANMGLRAEGLDSIAVFTEENLTLEAEKRLESQIFAIVRRNEGYTVQNYMETARDREQAQRQELILYLSIVVLFFAVSVGMIVSSVTRQLHSEGRTIGMLRAVGADEKVILGCYSGQINASHETLEPVISDVAGDLDVGTDGSVSLTITNPTTTQSIMDAEITVTDATGEIQMTGSNRMNLPEILPGQTETITIPMTVKGNASISQHILEVKLTYTVLGKVGEWKESFSVPVTHKASGWSRAASSSPPPSPGSFPT